MELRNRDLTCSADFAAFVATELVPLARDLVVVPQHVVQEVRASLLDSV